MRDVKDQKDTKDATRKVSAQPQETDFDATHRDEFAGQGGSYVIENGKRRLLERTKPAGAGRADERV